MKKTVIPDDVLARLATSLESFFSGKKVSESQNVMHIKSSDSQKSMGWIEVAKDSCSSILWDYNVLLEFPLASGSICFINHGNSFINEMLVKKFGGKISNAKYWIMYNEPFSPDNYGYIDQLPNVAEVVAYIEERYK